MLRNTENADMSNSLLT